MSDENNLILYHGSDHTIEKPEYGKGKIHNAKFFNLDIDADKLFMEET